MEFLRVLGLEKSLATRVIFPDQEQGNRMTDKKVRAKNNPKINILIVFIVFSFRFLLITSEPFGVSACSWPRKIEGDACDF